MDFFYNVWASIKASYFYDLRSTIVSICVLLGAFFFIKLLKDNGEKVYKSLRYLTCVVLCFVVAFILQ